jgi:hypothetical protein
MMVVIQILGQTAQGPHGNKGDARREVQRYAHVNHEVISARFGSAIAILIVNTWWYQNTDPQGCWPPARCEGYAIKRDRHAGT